jgi:hypothetical protein
MHPINLASRILGGDVSPRGCFFYLILSRRLNASNAASLEGYLVLYLRLVPWLNWSIGPPNFFEKTIEDCLRRHFGSAH